MSLNLIRSDNNKLTGTLPEDIGKLRKLRLLILSEFINCSYDFKFSRVFLLTLSIGHNKFEGQIPTLKTKTQVISHNDCTSFPNFFEHLRKKMGIEAPNSYLGDTEVSFAELEKLSICEYSSSECDKFTHAIFHHYSFQID